MPGVKNRHLIELDANFIVDFLRGGAAQNRLVEQWARKEVVVQISAVAWAEVLCGPLDESEAREARNLVAQVEPFTEADAALASDLFNGTGRRSRSLADCMIAAHAIARHASLATSNARDFRRFEPFHLKVVDNLDF